MESLSSRKEGGYKRGTQSVVAGLTAAIWDMDKAEVQDASLRTFLACAYRGFVNMAKNISGTIMAKYAQQASYQV